jgi:hypothetical protein
MGLLCRQERLLACINHALSCSGSALDAAKMVFRSGVQ